MRSQPATQGQRQSQAEYYKVITLRDNVNVKNNHLGFKITEHIIRKKILKEKWRRQYEDYKY